MDLKTYLEELSPHQCPRWDDRQKRLHALDLIRRSEHYEALLKLKDFDDARGKGTFGKGEDYVPVKDRRPGIEFDLPAIIVRDAISMTFSESKFPAIVYESKTDTEAVHKIVTESGLRARMPEIGRNASIGSHVVVLDVFKGDVDDDGGILWFEYWGTWQCDPVFNRHKPWVLESITRTWDVKRSQLVLDGYDVEALDKKWRKYELKKGWTKAADMGLTAGPRQYEDWYMRRALDATKSVWFEPVPKHIYEKKTWDEWKEDAERSDVHGLGFCPAVWATPGGGTWPDGDCLFKGAIKNSFMIDRVFSVGGQAIITAGMPQLATAKTGGANTFGTDSDGGETHGLGSGGPVNPDDVLESAEVGGWWLVQMKADSIEALDKWARLVRSISIENCGGSRISEDSLSGAKSGYALELLNQGLIWVVDQLRLSLGLGALMQLVRMVDRINKKIPIANLADAKLSDNAKLKELSWPPYYEPAGTDKLAEVQAAVAARDAGFISDETGVTQVAPLFDVIDVQTELSAAKKDADSRRQADVDSQVEVAKATKPTPPV